MRGGRERSCFIGSGFVVEVVTLGRRVEGALCTPPFVMVEGASLGRRVELDLCGPPIVVVGLLVFTRVGGGPIEAWLVMLPVALGGRTVVDEVRVGGLGSRVGD